MVKPLITTAWYDISMYIYRYTSHKQYMCNSRRRQIITQSDGNYHKLHRFTLLQSDTGHTKVQTKCTVTCTNKQQLFCNTTGILSLIFKTAKMPESSNVSDP